MQAIANTPGIAKRDTSEAKGGEEPSAVQRPNGVKHTPFGLAAGASLRRAEQSEGEAALKLVKVNELITQAAASLGLTVISTRLGQGRQKSLEICIYRQETAISFADCESMSRQLEQLFTSEEANGSTLINGPFTIDVVSPGIERRLTTALEFTLFAGKAVRILTREKIDSLGTEFTGVLVGGDEQSIMVTQVEPLQTGKKNSARLNFSNKLNKNVTLSLSQIYSIFLWPAGKQ